MRLTLVPALLISVAACTTAPPPQPHPPIRATWTQAGPGVEYAHFGDDLTASYHVVRIDLSEPQVQIFGSAEGDRGRTVAEFARAHGAIAAVNGDYFDEWLSPIGPARGYCGDWVLRAPPVSRRQPILIAGSQRARIIDADEPIPEWASAAVSGWPRLVTGCRAIPSTELPGSDGFTRAPHVRTAAGLSEDQRTLYLVVADLQRDGDFGTTLAALGAFMQDELGVCEALNLDGGGSSAMSVSGRTVSKTKYPVERNVANHLGIGMRAPACPDAAASSEILERVVKSSDLPVDERTASSVKLTLPFRDGRILLASSGDEVIATGSLVTSKEGAARLKQALDGDLRVSWTTAIDGSAERVQLGGRGSADSILRGLRAIIAASDAPQ